MWPGGTPGAGSRAAGRPTATSCISGAKVRAAFGEAIDGLLEGGVDLFMLETFSSSTTCASRREARRVTGRSGR
jgi:methionine synthase I (cobalamin-dependent)